MSQRPHQGATHNGMPERVGGPEAPPLDCQSRDSGAMRGSGHGDQDVKSSSFLNHGERAPASVQSCH